jgi:hypothetical protein
MRQLMETRPASAGRVFPIQGGEAAGVDSVVTGASDTVVDTSGAVVDEGPDVDPLPPHAVSKNAAAAVAAMAFSTDLKELPRVMPVGLPGDTQHQPMAV